MSHDLEASFAATEVVNYLLRMPADCFVTPPASAHLSGCAAREGRHKWPHADGVIELVVASGGAPSKYAVALEFKRPNEGLHGVLTAIGQSHAYLRKGYAGAVIVIPETYAGFGNPGPYVKEVIELTSKSEGIGVFTYAKPNLSVVSPFAGKLTLHKRFKIDAGAPIAAATVPARTETQWAHVREGSTDPDAFFKYLQSLKLLGGEGIEPYIPKIPPGLRGAVDRLRPGADPERYLSNCQNDELPDKAWRRFWFKYVLHPAAIAGWREDAAGTYAPNAVPLLIQKSDGSGRKMFFAGRSDSIKSKVCAGLNDGSLSVDDAWDELAKNYFKRAHSYREDVDSGCEHLGFIDGEGRLTDLGYKFVDACERYGNPNEGLPRAIFLYALLTEGALGAFLHYVHRLSENCFGADPLAFTKKAVGGGIPSFKHEKYLEWLESEMQTRLKVIRKVSARGGVARRPFQAELAVLRNLGIVSDAFRIGVGIAINWPELQEAMLFDGSSFRAH